MCLAELDESLMAETRGVCSPAFCCHVAEIVCLVSRPLFLCQLYFSSWGIIWRAQSVCCVTLQTASIQARVGFMVVVWQICRQEALRFKWVRGRSVVGLNIEHNDFFKMLLVYQTFKSKISIKSSLKAFFCLNCYLLHSAQTMSRKHYVTFYYYFFFIARCFVFLAQKVHLFTLVFYYLLTFITITFSNAL